MSPAPLSGQDPARACAASTRPRACATRPTRALKQAIVDADIYSHPGEVRLDERQLALSLGVSRTPIREAMTLLEQEGFLRTVPRARHLHRAQDQAADHRDDRDVGGDREHGRAPRDAQRVGRRDRGAAHRCSTSSATSTPAEHIHEYSDANIAFHQAIIRLSGSHLMGKTHREPVHPRARDPPADDLADATAPSRSIVGPHADHRGARSAATPELAERLVRQHSLGSRCATSRSTATSSTRAAHDEADSVDRARSSTLRTSAHAASSGGRRAGRGPGRAGRGARAAGRRAAQRVDSLIEFLHRHPGCPRLHLRRRHIVALAQEMKLAMTEVYEVATFYHHFDVVDSADESAAAAADRCASARRCRCQMAGARGAAGEARRARCGPDVRVIGAPCIRPLRARAGACASGHNRCRPRDRRTESQLCGRARGTIRGLPRGASPMPHYRAARRLRRRDSMCVNGERRRRMPCSRTMDDLGPARAGRRGLPGRSQVADRRAPSRRRG